MDPCPQCGFAYSSVTIGEVPEILRTRATQYRDALSSADLQSWLTVRPEPGVWSAQEYACHVRDVFLAQRERFIRALVEDGPTFPSTYRDERVQLAGYADEVIAEVLEGMILGADLLARVIERLSLEQALRTCVYTYVDPPQRDLTWVAQHTVHEAIHHLGDVRSVLARVQEPARGQN